MNPHLLHLLTLSVLICCSAASTKKFNYCSFHCDGKEHILCNDTESKCKSTTESENITTADILAMEKMHNVIRSRIAAGDIKGYDKAKNMIQLKYNKPLELMAKCLGALQDEERKKYCLMSKSGESSVYSVFSCEILISYDKILKTFQENQSDTQWDLFKTKENFENIIHDKTKYVSCAKIENTVNKTCNFLCLYSPYKQKTQDELYEKRENNDSTICTKKRLYVSENFKPLCKRLGIKEKYEKGSFSITNATSMEQKKMSTLKLTTPPTTISHLSSQSLEVKMAEFEQNTPEKEYLQLFQSTEEVWSTTFNLPHKVARPKITEEIEPLSYEVVNAGEPRTNYRINMFLFIIIPYLCAFLNVF